MGYGVSPSDRFFPPFNTPHTFQIKTPIKQKPIKEFREKTSSWNISEVLLE